MVSWPEQPPIPDQIEEVIAFRAWRVHTTVLGGPQLYSFFGLNHAWPTDDWMRATCQGDDQCKFVGPIPGISCYCGIYAARSRERLVADWNYNRVEGIVLGEVGLAGRIIPGTLAYRAERARPRQLYVAHADWKLVRPLQEAYQVPVHLTNVLTQGARRRRDRHTA